MTFVTPVDGQPALAEHVAQLTENLNGTRTTPITIGGVTTHQNSLLFGPDNTYDIGASGATRPRNLYLGSTVNARYITSNGNSSGGLTFTAVTATGVIDFSTNGGSRWQIAANGHLAPVGDNFYDIGASGANRPRTLYLAGGLVGNYATFSGSLTASGAAQFNSDAVVMGETFMEGGAWTGSHFRFNTNNTHDIGTSSTYKPRTIYAATSVVTPQLDTPLIAPTANTLEFRNGTGTVSSMLKVYYSYADAGNNAWLRFGFSGGAAYMTTDAIGSGTFRQLVFGTGGGTAAMNLMTGGTNRWQVTGTGHLITGLDNAYDIGVSGATRPRDLFLGRHLVLNTSSLIQGDFSNATQANRVLFQTSTSNSYTALGLVPAGTGVGAYLDFFSHSDIPNSSVLSLHNTGTRTAVVSQRNGTGSYLPLAFDTGGAERMRIETTGAILFGDGEYGLLDVSKGAASGGHTMVNTAVWYPLGTANNFSGMLIVNDTVVNGAVGIFALGAGQSTLIGQAAAATAFSSVQGTASRINVYADASGFVTIQNNWGTTVKIQVFALRTRSSA